MALLTREQILQATLRTEDVEVPEWGGSVKIRELTVAQQNLIEDNNRGTSDQALKTILEGVIDPRFEPSDYSALEALGTGPMSRVLSAIFKLSGMLKADQEEIPKE